MMRNRKVDKPPYKKQRPTKKRRRKRHKKNSRLTEQNRPESIFGNKDEDLQQVVQTFVQRKKKRKHQLSIIKSFFEDPLRFVLRNELAPSSSSVEQIEERQRTLQHRMELLKTLVEMAESEMQLLCQAEAGLTKYESEG